MNKQDFLTALESALSGLGEEEAKKSLDFYAEIIDDAVENGENEEEAVARIGSVEETAQKIINETPLAKLVKENVKKHKWSALEIVLIIVSSPIWVPLAAAVFAIGLSLYCTLWAIAASFFAAFAGLLLGGFVLAAAAFFMAVSNMPKAMISFGMGLASMGISAFVFWISVIYVKLIVRMTVGIIRGIKRRFIMKGGKNNETM